MTMLDPTLFEAPLRIGSRGSELARWQAEHVRSSLVRQWGPQLKVEIKIIATEGDLIQDRPLRDVGGKGLFVNAIERELIANEIDLAVHSMKDLPAELADGLMIASTPPREDPRDVLVAAKPGVRLSKLPEGSRVGTGSLRRAALAKRVNPAVVVVPVRGNVPTRLGRVDAGEVDAVILAAAGLARLGLSQRVTEAFELDRFQPSPCQGILALECRRDDLRVRRLVGPLSDLRTSQAAAAERAFMRRLEGGCSVPMGCYAEVRADDVITVTGMVVDPTGRPYYMATKVGHPDLCERLGDAVAETLLRLGAGQIIEQVAA